MSTLPEYKYDNKGQRIDESGEVLDPELEDIDDEFLDDDIDEIDELDELDDDDDDDDDREERKEEKEKEKDKDKEEEKKGEESSEESEKEGQGTEDKPEGEEAQSTEGAESAETSAEGAEGVEGVEAAEAGAEGGEAAAAGAEGAEAATAGAEAAEAAAAGAEAAEAAAATAEAGALVAEELATDVGTGGIALIVKIVIAVVIVFFIVVCLLYMVALILFNFGGGGGGGATPGATTTICIDPGHGGSDSGATNGSFREDTMNLIIAKELKTSLEGRGYAVIMTRNTDAEYRTNPDRATFCHNGGAQIMYRIHLDASTSPQKTFHIIPGPSLSNIDDTSKTYGTQIHNKMISELGGLVAGYGLPLTNGNYVEEGEPSYGGRILEASIKANELNMPVVLIEALAISDQGVAWISDTTKRAKLVAAITEGFVSALPPGSVGGSGATKVIELAKTQIGKPYVWGTLPNADCRPWSNEPPPSGCDNYDCSSFAGWAWYWGSDKSFSMCGTTRCDWGNRHDAGKYTFIASSRDAAPGDLVYWSIGSIHHVGIYLGSGKYIHAPSTGDYVKISDLSGRATPAGFLRPVVR